MRAMYADQSEIDDGFVRWLATRVIVRAVQDLQLDDTAAARTALVFLFGPSRDCAGWLGMLDVTTEFMRPRVVAHLEQQRDKFAGSNKEAQARRRRARIGLARIKDYVQRGALPKGLDVREAA